MSTATVAYSPLGYQRTDDVTSFANVYRVECPAYSTDSVTSGLAGNIYVGGELGALGSWRFVTDRSIGNAAVGVANNCYLQQCTTATTNLATSLGTFTTRATWASA